MNKINIKDLSIDTYAECYLLHILTNKRYYIDIYVTVLEKVLEQTHKHPADITFVDFGAGNGLLGIFASYIGIGNVYIVDTNKSFVNAATITAKALGISVNQFITGSEKKFLTDKHLKRPDVIAGTDVIEHIHNLDLFFSTIRRLNENAVTVFTTACNPLNRIKVKRFKAMQLKDELEGGKSADNVLFGNDHLPFLEIRKQIIQSYSSVLTTGEIESLALATRGMWKPDIEKSVSLYISSGKMPEKISHPTNTCDPYTGSWSERILSIDEYDHIYTRNGFFLAITCGFYNKHSSFVKRIMALLVNSFIKLFPYAGIRVAPFIVLLGKKK